MNEGVQNYRKPKRINPGLSAITQIARFYRILVSPEQLAHQLALNAAATTSEDLVRAAKLAGLKARIIHNPTLRRLRSIPVPAVLKTHDGWLILGIQNAEGLFGVVDPLTATARYVAIEELIKLVDRDVILITKRYATGFNPRTFTFWWFLPSIKRYRVPLTHVIVSSFFIQLFALVTPLLFQLIIDKVLVHKTYSTLTVLISGMVLLSAFGSLLKYLRTYALAHTAHRIDAELGSKLFYHLLRLPLEYFESRSAGVTVARMRELETIRNFLTGQGIFSAIDLLFVFVFVAVLFVYSPFLALVTLGAIPAYVVIATIVRPIFRKKLNEKFNRWSATQQFLVEAVVGIPTLKASAVEPHMQKQWEERLAAYVKTSFEATMLGSMGQNAIELVSRLSTALILLFGAQEVIEGRLSVGALIAFTMIANQVSGPILRISQLWQDFQQIQVSVERLGDILNSPEERVPHSVVSLPPPKGAIEIRNLTFRYRPELPDVIKSVSLSIKSGEVIGIVGASGSGKSTLTKLMQRLYLPVSGQILMDDNDLAQIDPAWLRRQLGVVLQENLLFNRTIHENIALARPDMRRKHVVSFAKLAGADEFISRLPMGYDTQIEERGINLSGGQRQRIAIARALSTNPRVLIFDEATSALDYESERIIRENMRHIVRGRTVIIIAHRLAAVRKCDRIVGMSNGEIVEIGTHDELLQRPNGIYARLWELQTDQSKG